MGQSQERGNNNNNGARQSLVQSMATTRLYVVPRSGGPSREGTGQSTRAVGLSGNKQKCTLSFRFRRVRPEPSNFKASWPHALDFLLFQMNGGNHAVATRHKI